MIYAVEQHPVFGPRVRARLAIAQSSGDSLMVSDLTRMECLVNPFRTRDAALLGQFQRFFTRIRLQVVAITPAVRDRAAQIRAATRLKPMDALQMAAALEHGGDVFLTNDIRLSSYTGVRVEVLPATP